MNLQILPTRKQHDKAFTLLGNPERLSIPQIHACEFVVKGWTRVEKVNHYYLTTIDNYGT